MINQIAPVPQAYYIPRAIDRELAQVRQIQAKLKASSTIALPKSGILWSPVTGNPATVRVSRWIE